MKTTRFWKFYAAGNSYVVVDDLNCVEVVLPWVNNPRRGIGGDGVLLMTRELAGRVAMRVFNADGTEAPMCGNGARCLAAIEFASNPVDSVVVLGDGGVIRHCLEDSANGLINGTMTLTRDPIIKWVSNDQFQLDIGTPQLVVFCDVADVIAERDGPPLEQSHAGGTNVMFSSIVRAGVLNVVPWERGVGAVDGCATGAAAAAIAAASFLSGWPERTVVRQPGGAITVVWDATRHQVQMLGTVALIAKGWLERQ